MRNANVRNILNCFSGHVYTGLDKFLHGQNLARFHLGFTWDRRNWTNFLTAKCEVCDLIFSGPELAHLAVQKPVQFRRSDPCKQGLRGGWKPFPWCSVSKFTDVNKIFCKLTVSRWFSLGCYCDFIHCFDLKPGYIFCSCFKENEK